MLKHTLLKSIPRLSLSFFLLISILSACQTNNEMLDQIGEIHLKAGTDKSMGPRWSPKGKKLALQKSDSGYETEIQMGDSLNKAIPIFFEPTKDTLGESVLALDFNYDGAYSESEKLIAKPSVSRGKMWHSFSASIPVMVDDPDSGERIKCSYPLSFWYVNAFVDEEQEDVIRYSRRGWMQGTAVFKQDTFHIFLTEMEMNGVYDIKDSWAIENIHKEDKKRTEYRNVDDFLWLGDQAFKIKALHPSGLRVSLEKFDPGMTKDEDELKRNPYRDDILEKRSGGKVPFMHDYQEALRKAKAENKMLFIDFETTWCGPCKKMDELIYTADRVVEAMSDFICVKVDGDKNREVRNKFQVNSYPTMIVLGTDGKEMMRCSGYQSVKKFLALLP